MEGLDERGIPLEGEIIERRFAIVRNARRFSVS